MSSIKVDVLSSNRVFPAARATAPVTTQLSIIDASVARFSPCGAIWYHAKPGNASALDPETLRSSLQQTLNSYPQWTGQLRMVPYDASISGPRTNSQRYGRIEVTYGRSSDPGVTFTVARTDASLEQLGLPGSGKQTPAPFWQCDDMAREDVFLPSDALASHQSAADHSTPCTAVQVTSLSCGGAAVAIQLFHSLADAHTLSLFMRDWSRVHAAALSGSPAPALSPTFEPALLDQRAAGSLHDPTPDAAILEQAHGLPLHRYDWWASAENSGFGPAACAVPEPLQDIPEAQAITAHGEKMPWATYDVMAPVSHSIIHYTSAQLSRIWTAASAPSNGDKVAVVISRHDALVAHVWGLLNRARGPEGGDGGSTVYADVTFGLRKRVRPALPDSWLGSPLQIAKIGLPWSVASAVSSLPTMAASIKATLAGFTPEKIAAQIYATAYELAPFRLWQAFLGRQHMLVTSWAHTGLYGCDFGTGRRPVYVHPIMPFCDGCVQIMEAAPVESEKLAGSDQGTGGGKRWYADGVDVAVYLEKEAMQRLLQDPSLHF